MTTSAASDPNWNAKLAESSEEVVRRQGNKLTFDVYWLENNGRPAASLDALAMRAIEVANEKGMTIIITDRKSMFPHWK